MRRPIRLTGMRTTMTVGYQFDSMVPDRRILFGTWAIGLNPHQIRTTRI